MKKLILSTADCCVKIFIYNYSIFVEIHFNFDFLLALNSDYQHYDCIASNLNIEPINILLFLRIIFPFFQLVLSRKIEVSEFKER